MDSPITHLKMTINEDKAWTEIAFTKHLAEPYSRDTSLLHPMVYEHKDWFWEEGVDVDFYIDGWTFIKHSRATLTYAFQVINELKARGVTAEMVPAYMIKLKHASIMPHKDPTKCSLNFVLGPADEQSPINIEGTEYYYKSALLNTGLLHWVNIDDKERYMLKLNVVDQTYEEVLQNIREIGLADE